MEFGLIERIRARVATRDDVVLGIGDDAALLQPPPGAQLAVATDTLNVGVHFPPGTAAADIGWKALAVNLSDLAAMGAEPAWCTLSLSLPEPDPSWLDGFLDEQRPSRRNGADVVERIPQPVGVLTESLDRTDLELYGEEVWVDFVQRLRVNPLVARDLLQTAELLCFDALVGGKGWRAPGCASRPVPRTVRNSAGSGVMTGC